jgi:GTP cyclohydrolase IA
MSMTAETVVPLRTAPRVDRPRAERAEVADWLHGHLGARGVGVVVEAEHLCMSLRGVRAHGSRTVTSALRGDIRTDARSRDEFLALTRHGG